MWKVVCSFSGTVYSRHKTMENAERAAVRLRRKLNSPNCGSLASHVQVVLARATFSRIVPANNEFGCTQLDQPVWR